MTKHVWVSEYDDVDGYGEVAFMADTLEKADKKTLKAVEESVENIYNGCYVRKATETGVSYFVGDNPATVADNPLIWYHIYRRKVS